MNFSPKWRTWIMECVSMELASVLVNGSLAGEFKLERGLRKTDPLSPFFFLIVAEGLSIFVDKAIWSNMLKVVEVGRDKVKISHLQYADVTIFMCPFQMGNIKAIKSNLSKFIIAFRTRS